MAGRSLVRADALAALWPLNMVAAVPILARGARWGGPTGQEAAAPWGLPWWLSRSQGSERSLLLGTVYVEALCLAPRCVDAEHGVGGGSMEITPQQLPGKP